MEDAQIIALYNQRLENAIVETDLKYGKLCRGISFHILNNREDSEECVNDTYLNTWNSIPPKEPKCFPAFLSKIVRNISLNKVKYKQTQKRGSGDYYLVLEECESILPSSNPVEESMEMSSLCEMINSFLGTISKQARLVFIGRYWYFDSISDISRKTGFSVSKVKMLLLRTRNELHQYLWKEGVSV